MRLPAGCADYGAESVEAWWSEPDDEGDRGSGRRGERHYRGEAHRAARHAWHGEAALFDEHQRQRRRHRREDRPRPRACRWVAIPPVRIATWRAEYHGHDEHGGHGHAWQSHADADAGGRRTGHRSRPRSDRRSGHVPDGSGNDRRLRWSARWSTVV